MKTFKEFVLSESIVQDFRTKIKKAKKGETEKIMDEIVKSFDDKKITSKEFDELTAAAGRKMDQLGESEEVEVISEAKVAGGFVGTGGKFNYAIKINGVDGERLAGGNFGETITLNKMMKKAKESGNEFKKEHIDAKGKGTLPAVKTWLKEKKPSQFYAKWQKDSSSYKDDSVEIKYLD